MFLKVDKETMSQATNKKGNLMTENGQPVLNWKLWASTFGFTKFINIEHIYNPTEEALTELIKISNYITKYIAKDFILLRENKKKYWSSRGMTKPIKSTELILDIASDCERQELNLLKFHTNLYPIINRETGEIERTVSTNYLINVPF